MIIRIFLIASSIIAVAAIIIAACLDKKEEEGKELSAQYSRYNYHIGISKRHTYIKMSFTNFLDYYFVDPDNWRVHFFDNFSDSSNGTILLKKLKPFNDLKLMISYKQKYAVIMETLNDYNELLGFLSRLAEENQKREDEEKACKIAHREQVATVAFLTEISKKIEELKNKSEEEINQAKEIAEEVQERLLPR